MRCFTNYSRFNTDTINGETLVIFQRYTTFDKAEMDAFEESIRNTIGYGVMTDIKMDMPPHIEADNCGNYVVMQPTAEVPKDQYEAILKAERER